MFDTRYDSIPSNLDNMQPGPELAALLADIDVEQVSPHDRVIVLRAHRRMRSHYDAQTYRDMASIVDALGDDHPQYGAEFAVAEIEVALQLTRRAAENEVAVGMDLHRRLPQVWCALDAGVIDLPRARAIADRTSHLSVGTAWEVAERVLVDAPTLTTGQLRARLDRMGMEADPEAAQQQYKRAVADRRVFAERTTDGTGNLLGLDLPPHKVSAASRKINNIARSLKTKNETRTMDQIRADVYLDLLVGDTKKGYGGVVDIHIPLDTLTETANDPGELNGYGPVVADIARQVADQQRDAEWRWSVTDPDTGQTVANGTTRRRATTRQRRDIQARNRTCAFPGCRMPSLDCDIDHRERWADGGPTTKCNLAPLCRGHHRIKDLAGWTYVRLNNGRFHWTTKLGHTYITSGRSP